MPVLHCLENNPCAEPDDAITLHDLVLHGGVAVAGGSDGGGSAGSGVLVGGGGTGEVVGHLGVELLGSLLDGAAGAATAAGALLATATGASALGIVGLASRSRLGLGLGLRGALSKSLGDRNDAGSLGGVDDDLDLDRTSIDKEAVQLLEGLASAIRLAEDDVGDAAADRVGAVGNLDLLDGANCLGEVFLN